MSRPFTFPSTSKARFTLPLKFFRPARESIDVTSKLRVWYGNRLITASGAEFEAPACIHHSVGVTVIGELDVFRKTEYGVNVVPAGKDIMGSAAPTINPSVATLVGAVKCEDGGNTGAAKEDIKRRFAE
jgi:hypothetical protein